MKIIQCKHGTPEWRAARLGVPTASNFHRIVTPTGKPSAQADKYMAELVAEWFLGAPLDEFTSGFMERGTNLEPEARRYYEFDTDSTVTEVGFVLRDDGKAGCSPDGLVGDDGCVEIKTPSAGTQMHYVLNGVEAEYKPQVQGQLWVCEREWSDLLCFNPSLPKVLVRFGRDEEYIENLSKAVGAFCLRLDEAKKRLANEKAERDRAAEEAEIAAGEPF